MVTRLFSCIVVVVSLAAISSESFAEDFRSQVEGLFAKSGKVSPSALDAAREQFAAIEAGGANRQLADYAFVLVLIEQQKLDEAGAQLDKLLKVSPSSSPFRRTRTWVQLVRKEHQAALVNLETLAKSLAKAKDAKITTDHRDTARFLGSAVAFLQGPAAASRLDKLVAASKSRVLEGMEASLREEFDAGQAATTEQFEKLGSDVTGAKDEVAKIQADAIKTQGEQIESEQGNLDEAKKALQDAADEQQKKAQAEAESLQAQYEELRGAFLDVQARAIPIEAQIASAQAEIQSLITTEQRDDGTIETRYSDPNRAAALQGLIAQLNSQLAPMRTQMFNINGRASQVQNQYNGLVQRHHLQLQRISGEGMALKAGQKKLERAQKQHARSKPTGNSTKTRTLSSRLTNFTTYEPFPMAQEKARILAAIK